MSEIYESQNRSSKKPRGAAAPPAPPASYAPGLVGESLLRKGVADMGLLVRTSTRSTSKSPPSASVAIKNYFFFPHSSFHHLPSDFSLSTFFPALAMLQHLIEPLTAPNQTDTGLMTTKFDAVVMTSEQKKQLHEVLLAFTKAYRQG